MASHQQNTEITWDSQGICTFQKENWLTKVCVLQKNNCTSPSLDQVFSAMRNFKPCFRLDPTAAQEPRQRSAAATCSPGPNAANAFWPSAAVVGAKRVDLAMHCALLKIVKNSSPKQLCKKQELWNNSLESFESYIPELARQVRTFPHLRTPFQAAPMRATVIERLTPAAALQALVGWQRDKLGLLGFSMIQQNSLYQPLVREKDSTSLRIWSCPIPFDRNWSQVFTLLISKRLWCKCGLDSSPESALWRQRPRSSPGITLHTSTNDRYWRQPKGNRLHDNSWCHSEDIHKAPCIGCNVALLNFPCWQFRDIPSRSASAPVQDIFATRIANHIDQSLDKVSLDGIGKPGFQGSCRFKEFLQLNHGGQLAASCTKWCTDVWAWNIRTNQHWSQW